MKPIASRDGRRWFRAHINYDGDECLIWPFSRRKNDGRGQVNYQGKTVETARLMCRLAHGEPPTPAHQAAHSCGNGHIGCINPKHLRWATHKENEADKLIHGTLVRGEQSNLSKLKERQVLAIREFAHNVSVASIARLFDVTPKNVRRIIARDTWSHI